MANSLCNLTRLANIQLFKSVSNSVQIGIEVKFLTRHLYAASTLGLDAFEEQRGRVTRQFANITDKFMEKMKDITSEESKNMVFTEDLKNMVHLVKNDEELDLVVKMMNKFNKQNSQLRFGNYVFGPVVMRMFHMLNKPDIAFQCFKDPEFGRFFDQLITYQILLDLLYENQKYDEILEAFEVIKDKRIDGMRYPRNVIVLVYAALYKKNTMESIEYGLNLWKDLIEIGHFPMRRATTFCAGLALNRGNPAAALEIISSCKNQSYTTVRNIKVVALCGVGKVEEAVSILKGVLATDNPTNNVIQTVNRNVLEIVKGAVEELGNADLSADFNRVEQLFQKEGHISEITLDEQLCSHIAPPAYVGKNQRQQYSKYQRVDYGDRADNKYKVFKPRPGLHELQ